MSASYHFIRALLSAWSQIVVAVTAALNRRYTDIIVDFECFLKSFDHIFLALSLSVSQLVSSFQTDPGQRDEVRQPRDTSEMLRYGSRSGRSEKPFDSYIVNIHMAKGLETVPGDSRRRKTSQTRILSSRSLLSGPSHCPSSICRRSRAALQVTQRRAQNNRPASPWDQRPFQDATLCNLRD